MNKQKQELLYQIQCCKKKIDKLPHYFFPPTICCYTMDRYIKGASIQHFTYCPFCGKYIKEIKGVQEYE